MSIVFRVALSGLCLAAAAARAETLPPPDPRAAVSIVSDNDSYARQTDRWYTAGNRFAWSSAEDRLPDPLAALDRSLAGLFGAARGRWGLAFGQSLFTPEDKRRRDPDPRDRPYAGFLYGELSLDRRTATTLDRFSLTLGVVGPSALGRPTQDAIHSFIGDRPARGWHFQLQDEPVFNLAYDRIWRLPAVTLPGGVELDSLPAFTLAAGTVQTYAGLGTRIRIGQGLGADFGPARIRPSLGDAPAPIGQGFGWYLFGGAGGRVVGRDIFLDGNTFRDSRSVDHRPFVGEAEFGAAVFWQNIRFSYTQVFRTKEFVGQRVGSVFGAFALSLAF